ncbi:hypothetical protein [Paenibacillus silviterrae]|uniref:hypothetical protein n=1 Tax=Paenibacillus silviterrae TaxID=3242194 RepID=UPI0025431C24|nr:hypothetical protein [Paenibacillus chinjuensis]
MLKLHIGAKRLPPIIQKKVKALELRNNAYKAAYLEFLCIFESANQLIKSFPLNSELPIVVVTAGKQSED